ncbi:MAG TPA: site-specific DNA-methyltransferase [Methylomirabilota bacterium]|nr:site-specific DNA-methyltransferase [Methylomirabilota bacterium]
MPDLANYRLVHGDCLVELPKLESESIDVVVTSPPYNLGIAYNTYKDTASRDAFLEWCEQWCGELKRVLKEHGSFFLNVGSSPSDPLLPHELALRFSKILKLQNTFHWIKSITITTPDQQEISAGHFKPINSERFVTDCHEYVFHFTKSGARKLDRLAIGVEYVHKSNIARWGHTEGKDRRCRGNNWFIPYKTIMSRDKERPHPATFPVQLAVNCFKIHGIAPGMKALDPFVGIGHSALAALSCGVEGFLGIDIDADYLATAQSQISHQKATKFQPS